LIGHQIKSRVIDRIIEILKYCIEPKTKYEILERIGLSKQTKNFKENIEPAIDVGLLAKTIPDRPKSKHQKYITTEMGKKIINEQE